LGTDVLHVDEDRVLRALGRRIVDEIFSGDLQGEPPWKSGAPPASVVRANRFLKSAEKDSGVDEMTKVRKLPKYRLDELR
jgi:hypothetical protein